MSNHESVAAGLVPAIHVFAQKTWMPAPSAGMTDRAIPSEMLAGAADFDTTKPPGQVNRIREPRNQQASRDVFFLNLASV